MLLYEHNDMFDNDWHGNSNVICAKRYNYILVSGTY